MFSWKNALPLVALVVLLNACGTSPAESERGAVPSQSRVTPADASGAQDPVRTEVPTDMQSSYVQVDGADGQSVFACSYSINGKTVEGKSKEECDRLKKDFEKAAGTPSVPAPAAPQTPPASGQTQVNCAFNINGKSYVGNSQAECDKLKKDLGLGGTAPTTPASPPAPSQGSTPATNVACAFNINGKSYVGNSQAECDKLKKDLGLQF
ncbi:MAG TPA: hypothetical protein VE954_35515 [Oligoflexus sp.]|uniref:hypothetical protein n=1 Tax=Oligoflexus sp. TaxID=1971216 RepID=UPI002D3F89CE|nr:hypothetical protein [Oligoflexus sp.]HYX38442.1 hypothetical protein [Oligoflexus sp.]